MHHIENCKNLPHNVLDAPSKFIDGQKVSCNEAVSILNKAFQQISTAKRDELGDDIETL